MTGRDVQSGMRLLFRLWLWLWLHLSNGDPELPPCSAHTIYHGSWNYDREILIEKSPYEQCPKTKKKILSIPNLKNQVSHYSCINKTYHHAQYLPSSSCSILPLIKSFQILVQKQIKLFFVGDSLMAQLYIAFLCTSERYGFYQRISHEFLPELFLRPDIPCDPLCRHNATFLAEENLKGIHQRCFGCPEGVYHELNASFPLLSQFWPSKLRQDGATHVLIGAGSWYTGYRKLLSPDEEYNRTLATIKPILESLGRGAGTGGQGMAIHWLDLPPMTFIPPPYEDLFGWNNFIRLNLFAKETFRDSPWITYLDTAHATRARKMRDLNITDEFQHHWCNPGGNMIPTFQLRTYLHLIAQRLLPLPPRTETELPSEKRAVTARVTMRPNS
jgi:hypothetical protein